MLTFKIINILNYFFFLILMRGWLREFLSSSFGFFIEIGCEDDNEKYGIQEYPVSLDDYWKIKIGDKITLEKPNSSTDNRKIAKIE